MSYFLFVDESGQDHNNSPYEVIAGLAVEDKDLWHFIRLIHDFEFECFGWKYGNEKREIKARGFLNRKTFRLANQMPPINEEERAFLANQALNQGNNISKAHLTALAQAKLAYVEKILKLCDAIQCKVFSCIVSKPAFIDHTDSMLRKEYVYLFERFYYFLERREVEHNGIIVLDEMEKSMSHILINQMDKYFKRTFKGAIRSNLIIPEPMFVHSDMTTGIQVVDFIAYIISWNLRNFKLKKPGRPELNHFLRLVKSLEFKFSRHVSGYNYKIKSITII
jgi:hypothetical protein